MNTPIEKQAEILAQLWMDYRDEDYFRDFFGYADLGFPLSYLLTQNVVTRNAETDKFIGDTWEMLLSLCGLEEDEGYEDLEDVLRNVDLEDPLY
jgi:hypothetical protein